MGEKKEQILQGIPISRGIAIGIPFLFSFPEEGEISLSAGMTCEDEWARYLFAWEKSRNEILQLREQLREEEVYEADALVEAQLYIMQDSSFTRLIEKEIVEKGRGAVEVFRERLEALSRKFHSLDDVFFRERFKDVQDVGNRILRHLSAWNFSSLADVPKSSVIFANELSASDAASAKLSHVQAFVTEAGSAHSHAAIIAKAKGIPYIASVRYDIERLRSSKGVIIDGRTGTIILDPLPETVKKYRELERVFQQQRRGLEERARLPCETQDGVKISLFANVEMVDGIEDLKAYGTEGIGLFRSEFLWLTRTVIPSEEEQYEAYCTLLRGMAGKRVVIRTYDFSGDKLPLRRQVSPQIKGLFATRGGVGLMDQRDVFVTQMRAIIRASFHGRIDVLFPMVSSYEELVEAKHLLFQAKEMLREEGYTAFPTVFVGCMIETPAAVLTMDLLAQECDFFSIGTNDLMQYAMGMDRRSAMVEQPMFVALIRFLQKILENTVMFHKPVSICGEIAADPRFIPLLLGLGFREFSVSIRAIPVVKNIVRNTSLEGIKDWVQAIVSASKGEEIAALLARQEECDTKHNRSLF